MKKFLLSIALCCAATNFFAQTTEPGNLINEGKAALEAKNYQEAFTKFSTYLTQTNNQDSVIAYNCGVCADKIKKPEEALKYFDIAIQKKYNLGNAYVGKAGALKDLKKDSEYLATLKEGIEAAPENKTLKRLHANYYLNAGIKAQKANKLDRPGNRSGRQCERINVLFDFLEFLFVPNAETLLLVKDKQAKIRENHIVRKEPMRTDEDVDLSGSRRFEHFFLLG